MKQLLTLCGIVILAGCATAIPFPTDNDTSFAQQRWPHTARTDLHAGRKLYIDKCSGCHSAKPPALYSEKKWNEILPEMNEKAKLQNNEAELLKKYLITMTNHYSSNTSN
ncbi:MAG: hypothetical protein PHP42_06250 [Bacteroidota bacterium]|nr:hypothetical protein [Bacteroidota bacterium]